MVERMGDFIETYTGTAFYAFDPHPDEVHIDDIAHALSLICRFNGHTSHFYSVGQHSINCARELLVRGAAPEFALLGLLHDASEAYLCDIPRPLKPYINGYAEAESQLMDAILKKYGLENVDWTMVHQIDNDMLAFEANRLMPCKCWNPPDIQMSVASIDEQSPYIVQSTFLSMFEKLKEESTNGTNHTEN